MHTALTKEPSSCSTQSPTRCTALVTKMHPLLMCIQKVLMVGAVNEHQSRSPPHISWDSRLGCTAPHCLSSYMIIGMGPGHLTSFGYPPAQPTRPKWLSDATDLPSPPPQPLSLQINMADHEYIPPQADSQHVIFPTPRFPPYHNLLLSVPVFHWSTGSALPRGTLASRSSSHAHNLIRK